MIKRTDTGFSLNTQVSLVLGSWETPFKYMDGGSWCKEPALIDDPALSTPLPPILCSQPSFDDMGTNALSQRFFLYFVKRKKPC